MYVHVHTCKALVTHKSTCNETVPQLSTFHSFRDLDNSTSVKTAFSDDATQPPPSVAPTTSASLSITITLPQMTNQGNNGVLMWIHTCL